LLFLSYAEEDKDVAGKIAAWFIERDFKLFDWLAPERRGRQFVREIEKALAKADVFVALLSPDYLESRWCQNEWDLAHKRELDLQRDEPNRTFIHMILVAQTRPEDAGFIRNYDWGDLIDHNNVGATLAPLTGRINSSLDPVTGSLPRRTVGRPSATAAEEDYFMKFRNRENELDRVLLGITNFAGPHFWLVTSPPHLGKSWFVRRLRSDEKLASWDSELVDLRQETPEVRADPDALIELLFGPDTLRANWPDTQRAIVKKIAGSRRPYLCLIDSAELIDQKTAHSLRSRLGDIHEQIQDRYANDIRLAVVVASRRDAEWRGINPKPRLTALSLTEFNPTVVRKALNELAELMDVNSDGFNMHAIARTVHEVTEGLPALLLDCLMWIKEQVWTDLEQLEMQSFFENLAEPYIFARLLSYDSLFPANHAVGSDVTDERAALKARIVVRAYQVLAPYRLFTQSHLRHHVQDDAAVCSDLDELGWTLESLWNAVSDAALLQRPLEEPWQEIHPAIRRLLYRHRYATPAARVVAHKEAREFVAIWGEQQLGKEQTIGIIECLWHEAMAQQDSTEDEFKRVLRHSAAELSLGLERSPLYTVEELRVYTSDRMKADTELSNAFSHFEGFFFELTQIVEDPRAQPET
jgi:hypothetical protein